MAAGDDQRMPWVHGPDVEKRHRQLVLADTGGTKIARDDSAEGAGRHMVGKAWEWSWIRFRRCESESQVYRTGLAATNVYSSFKGFRNTVSNRFLKPSSFHSPRMLTISLSPS